jgi:4a-hydroxytetrahydrobiopterin dehydratase
MTDLFRQSCVRIHGDETKLTDQEITEFLFQIPEWQVKEVDGEKRLERVFRFKSFAQALQFTNKIGEMSEEEDHHPLIVLEYGRVAVDWWTHKIGGLHKNDFIMAARTEQLV